MLSLCWLSSLPSTVVRSALRSDNGPEFIAVAVKKWLDEHSIGTHYIDPGSPWQNAFNESLQQHFPNDLPESLGL